MEENESIIRTANTNDSTECRTDSILDPQNQETPLENEGALSDTLPKPVENQTEPVEGELQEVGLSTDRDLLLPANSDQNPDSGPADGNQEDERGEMSRLRNELKDLKEALQKRDAFYARLGTELEEFSDLYPETSLAEIPETVWSDVRKGIPLAASFALLQKKNAVLTEAAATANRQNLNRSSGALETPENDFFTPDEVRAMSREEVRKNYSKIMSSMPKWH